MVTCSYDTNAILVRPLKSRMGKELVEVISNAHDHLTLWRFKPNHQILDNEASFQMKLFMQTRQATFQLVPPRVRRRNIAERVIRTCKNHLISILCGAHPDFSLFLWCKLLPQSEITLNLVRPCRVNPKLSACKALKGSCSCNYAPLAPLGG